MSKPRYRIRYNTIHRFWEYKGDDSWWPITAPYYYL